MQAVLQIASLAVLARLVEPREFGLLAAAMIAINFSAIFTQLGVAPAVVRQPDLHRDHIRSAFAISLYIGGAFALILILIAPLVGALLRLEVTSILRALSALFVVQAFGTIAEALLQRELRFRQLAIIDVSSYALGFGVIAISLALHGYGVWALVWGQICQALLKTSLLSIARPHVRGLGLHRGSVAELLNFGAGFTLAKLFNFAAVQGDNAVVARWLGPASLGLYSQAYQFIVMPANLFGAVLDRVLFPAMAVVQGEPARLASAYVRSVSMSVTVTAPVAIAVFVLAPEMVGLLLGVNWLPVVGPLQVLALGLVFRTAYKMSDSLTRATGAVYRRAWRQAIYAGAVILGSLVGQRWGIVGVAWGVTIAITLNYALMAHLSLTLAPIGLPRFLAAHTAAVVLALVCGIPAYALAEALRHHGLGDLMIIVTTLCVEALLIATIIALCPRVLLGGNAGSWKTILGHLKGKRVAAAGVTQNGS